MMEESEGNFLFGRKEGVRRKGELRRQGGVGAAGAVRSLSPGYMGSLAVYIFCWSYVQTKVSLSSPHSCPGFLAVYLFFSTSSLHCHDLLVKYFISVSGRVGVHPCHSSFNQP